MSEVLDEFPLDFARPQLRALHGLIARTLYQPSDVQAVVLDSGMNPATVNFSGNSAVQWYSALTEARAQELLPEMLAAVRRRQPSLAVASTSWS